MLIAINFHYVRPVFDAPYPGIHGITPAQFESQLTLLSRAGKFVSASDIRQAARGGKDLPARALVVTFDDGLREQYEHASAILGRLGIPAIYFVNTRPIDAAVVSSVHKIHLLRAHVAPGEFLDGLKTAAAARRIELDVDADAAKAVEHYKYDEAQAAKLKYLLNFALAPGERDALVDLLFDRFFQGQEASISRRLYMGPEQIGELGRQQSIGTHAHEHLPLGLLSEQEAEDQIERSAMLIEQWTGSRPFALSYPYGSREASSIAAARAAARQGIEFAFTMERAANPSLADPLHLARFDNNDLPGGKAARWGLDELFAAAAPRTWFAAGELTGKAN